MPDKKLSQREADLITQARQELGLPAPARAAPAVPEKRSPPEAARGSAKPVAAPASNADPDARLAALMAAMRTENAQRHAQLRQRYVWAPLAALCVVGLWALLWLWLKF